ncbi:zinc finger protein 436-like [Brachionichthys hirsutus]|uniref:zinc finger protein 436-like n=1 Tax=Brachionichthys hirsutus TaxID=412623 RepID=UPI0036043674
MAAQGSDHAHLRAHDPDLQDPLSPSINENYPGQNSPDHLSKKASVSPDYNYESPEVQVIIKEEEEGWTVSENHPDESFRSEAEKEATSTHPSHPHLKELEKDGTISYRTKGQKRDSPEHKVPMPHGVETASTNLEDQTLHLTVRLQAGQEEEEEVIGGLINSDGEVVEWEEGDDGPDHGSDCTDSPQPRKGGVPSMSQLRGQTQREGRTLITEVVPVEGEEEREKERVAKMQAVSSLNRGRRQRRKKKAPEMAAASSDVSDTETVPARPGKKRPGRKMVCVPVEIPPELLKKPKEKIQYHCSVCGKEFPHAYKRERHELIHTGERPYCCSICGRGFNQKGNLKTHYKVHYGRKGAADLDDEVNPKESELSEYLKSLPGESRIRSSLHCTECEKKCDGPSPVQEHHVATETADEPDDTVQRSRSQLFFCRRCSVRLNDEEELEEHMRTHVKEKPYSCPDCGKRFINESYIEIHQRIHTGEKPFLCSQCGRGFHTASSLKLHEMQHSGERPFACSICGKTFRINSYLTAHYQTHVKDRPFVCSVCGKGYSRAEELKVHHRLHTGERPYECGQCGKSFIYRQGLRQHQRTHAGRRIGPTRQLGRPKQDTRLDV